MDSVPQAESKAVILMELILASGSPRRKEILENMGYRFTVKPSDAARSLRREQSLKTPQAYWPREKPLRLSKNSGKAGRLILPLWVPIQLWLPAEKF